MRYGLALVLALLLAAPATASALSLDAERRTALSALAPLVGAPLGGEPLSAADLENKVVLVTFFASWCPPCTPEFKNVNAVYAEFKDRGFEALAVNIFEEFGGRPNPARLEKFLDRTQPAFRLLSGGEAVGPLFEDVERIPTVFIFGRDGQEGFRFIHGRGAAKTHASEEEIRAAVEALL